MTNEWNIKSMEQNCSGCEKPFHDKEKCCSLLDFTEAGYIRSDYCLDCWNRRQNESPPFSVWQTVYTVPPPEPEEPLKKENAENLLRRLMKKEDSSKDGVRYILAVMLERKKLLVERDTKTTDHGDKIRIYEHRKTGETLIIRDPQLNLNSLGKLQRQVADMLS
ncbi:MAG: hypothetical protein ACOC6C_01300 [Verrucomicrobiota bacterium]